MMKTQHNNSKKSNYLMKFRKLILKTHLQQIEKQYRYIFIFHCSGLTNSQWKWFKNFLHITNAQGPKASESFAQTNSKGTLSRELTKEEVQPICGAPSRWPATRRPNVDLGPPKGGPLTKGHKVTTVVKQQCGVFFMPKGRLKLNLLNHLYLHPINSDLTFNSGPLCIIYFNREEANNLVKFWSEIITKMSLLGANTSLVLLYAQIETTLMNHMDLKQALKLETKSAFQPLLWSVLSPTQNLCSSMFQPIHELVHFQNNVLNYDFLSQNPK